MNPPGMTFCPQCATPLQLIAALEDGGPKERLRCPACAWTHWNNPTPVLAAVIELADRDGQLLLARNAAWPSKMFGLKITDGILGTFTLDDNGDTSLNPITIYQQKGNDLNPLKTLVVPKKLIG